MTSTDETWLNSLRRWSTGGVLFAVGFFSLLAQTLLFRAFLSAFEGNELAIAVFFASWLFWIGVGAAAARLRFPGRDFLRSHFGLLVLFYLPASVLQGMLIAQSRAIAGVAAYELFPLFRMLSFAFILNAPVSFCTGLIFAFACGWVRETDRLPVARVYILESMGSAVGGGVVTLLLFLGVSAESAFLLAATVLTLALGLNALAEGRQRPLMALPALLVIAHLGGAAGHWEKARDRQAWSRLMPAESYRGAFTTSHGRYRYGTYRGQFSVVARESIADNIPAVEHASEVAAIHLAQRPAARRFLVAGPEGFSICRRLLTLPQTDTVVWLDPDPEYPARLVQALPPDLAADAQRIRIPGQDIRQYLRTGTDRFDVVILNLPGNTSLSMNRYFSREFFSDIRARLAPSGMVGVRVSGGENFLGGELIRIGASAFATLGAVFRNQTLKPGEETWLFASDGPALESTSAVLRDRFRSIENSASLYPPEAILALYPPDRIAFQLDAYRRAIREHPGETLINTDRHPRSLVYALLLAALEAGARLPLIDRIDTVSRCGWILAALAGLLYIVLRTAYGRGRSGPAAGPGASCPATAFDNAWLVSSTGAAGMALGMVLMFLYQAQFGSLFLHVGLVAALFMGGLASGGWLAGRVARRGPRPAVGFLRAGWLAHVVLAGILGLAPVELPTMAFAGLFFTSGFLGGIYLPLAAANLGAAGVAPEAAGSRLEWADHLGGCLGGLFTGMLLIPVLGVQQAAVGVSILLATNLPALLGCGAGSRARGMARPAIFIAGGVAVFLIVSSAVLDRAGAASGSAAFRSVAEAMAGDLQLQEREAVRPDGTRSAYFIGATTNGVAQIHVLRTDAWASGINGFGGPIVMAVAVRPDGALADLRILESRETPAYLDGLIRPWLGTLRGRTLWGDAGIDKVDAVTGATVSSVAIRRTLRETGRKFATSVLGLREAAARDVARLRFEPAPWVLLAVAIVALILRRRPRPRLRPVFLLAVAVGLGLGMNAQYSVEQLLSLLGFHIPPMDSGLAVATVVGVPLLVILFGNAYCGYLCPFGAFQDLAGDLFGRSRASPTTAAPGRRVLAPVRFVLLFLVVALFAVTRNTAFAASDPLVMVFSRHMPLALAVLAAVLVILSLVHPRFWCRYLCPAGAFLSLLNSMRLLRRWFPLVQKRACVYGFPGIESAECLGCDRCAVAAESAPGVRRVAQGAGAWNVALAAAVLALAMFYATRMVLELTDHRAGVTSVSVPAAGKARPVDVRQIKRFIEDRRLSDHEALYYRKLENGPTKGE